MHDWSKLLPGNLIANAKFVGAPKEAGLQRAIERLPTACCHAADRQGQVEGRPPLVIAKHVLEGCYSWCRDSGAGNAPGKPSSRFFLVVTSRQPCPGRVRSNTASFLLKPANTWTPSCTCSHGWWTGQMPHRLSQGGLAAIWKDTILWQDNIFSALPLIDQAQQRREKFMEITATSSNRQDCIDCPIRPWHLAQLCGHLEAGLR